MTGWRDPVESTFRPLHRRVFGGRLDLVAPSWCTEIKSISSYLRGAKRDRSIRWLQ